jgi:CubicO group peptidase (beta-lactamase class C family)
MAKNWFRVGIGVFAAIAAAIAAFVVGLYVYVNATATPIHPDPKSVTSVADSTPAGKWASAADQSRELVRAALTEQNLPGVSVAVGAGGEIVWTEGFGFADIEKKTGVTPNTRFRMGDVSVPLTSAAVGVLVEKDRLNLDTSIQKYVPDYPEKQWTVSLRQLMGHVAGVRTDAGDEESLSQRCRRATDGLPRFAADPLRFEPETKVRVSSYGWILVSAAVEAASGEPFFTFVRSRVFEPLGMTATRPYLADEQIPDLPTFYFPRFGGDTRLGPELAREGDQSCLAGAAAFLSTSADLVRFGNGIMSGKLLKPETVETLQKPLRLTTGEETGYGLGWKLENLTLAGHPVRMAGYDTKQDFIGGTTSLMTFPERRLVVAVMTNTSFADTKALALKIADAFALRDTGPAK